MTPARPLLPTDWSLPFQLDADSHTSILISESVEGVNVAVTRQNAGRRLNYCPPMPAPSGAGGAKAPAATFFADVMFLCGGEILAKLSQDVAIAVEALDVSIANRTKKTARTIGRCKALLVNMLTSSRQFQISPYTRSPMWILLAEAHGELFVFASYGVFCVLCRGIRGGDL